MATPVTGQKIKALFCGQGHFSTYVYATPFNKWCHVAPSDDDSEINMTTMLTHAKANDRFVDLYVDTFEIRQIYVW